MNVPTTSLLKFSVLTLTFSSVLVISCAGRPEILPTREVPIREVPGSTVVTADKNAIREDDQYKAYHVGRLPDASNHNLMHEEHTLYRREKTETWNLNPQDGHLKVTGPLKQAPAKADHSAMLADYEQRIAELKEREAVIIEQNEALIKANESSNQTLQELEGVLKEVALLKAQLESLQKEAQEKASKTEPEEPSNQGWLKWPFE